MIKFWIALVHIGLLIHICDSSIISVFFSSITAKFSNDPSASASASSPTSNIEDIKNAIKLSQMNKNNKNWQTRCKTSSDCSPYYFVCFSGYCITKRCVLSISCPDDSYCSIPIELCLQKTINYKNLTIDLGNGSIFDTTTSKPTTKQTEPVILETVNYATTVTTTEMLVTNSSGDNNLNGLIPDTPKYQQTIQVNNHNHPDSNALIWSLTVGIPMLVFTSVFLALIFFCKNSLKKTATRIRALNQRADNANTLNNMENFYTDPIVFQNQTTYQMPKPTATPVSTDTQPPTYNEVLDQLPSYNSWSKRQQRT